MLSELDDYEDDVFSDAGVDVDAMATKIYRLESERDRLRDALKLYANKRLWHRDGHGWLCVFRGDTNGPAIALTALQQEATDV